MAIQSSSDLPVPQSEHESEQTRGTRKRSVERIFLYVLCVVFVAKGVLFTFNFPAFSGHDEVAHMMYLKIIAEDFRPPLIPDLGDWRQEYEETNNQRTHDRMDPALWQYCLYVTKDWYQGCEDDRYTDTPIYAITFGVDERGFPEYFPSGWVYSGNHPPLYYLIMTPIYWLFAAAGFATKLYALRLAAIPFGLLTIFFAWKTVKELFPENKFLALSVPTFVAFQPQISYEAAMLNNDILAVAMVSGVFYFLARGMRTEFTLRINVLIGVFFGLALLAKSTSLIAGLVIAAAMVLAIGWRNWRKWVTSGAISGGVAGLLIWPWYLYMLTTYGDLTALARIEELQYWNYQNGERPTIWSQFTDKWFARLRWSETWGEFGWRLIPLDWNLLVIILWFCIVGLLGVALWYWRVRRAERAAAGSAWPLNYRSSRVAVITWIIACLIGYYSILQFGTTFALTQARYYFPMVNAFAILIMLGYSAIIPRRWHFYAAAAMLLLGFLLNFVIFSEYLIPYHNKVL